MLGSMVVNTYFNVLDYFLNFTNVMIDYFDKTAISDQVIFKEKMFTRFCHALI